MSELDTALRKSIGIGLEIETTINTKGFNILLESLSDTVKELDEKLKETNDPNVALACIKKKNGILLINEVANELIQAGKRASSQLSTS